ncbi:hypothetical protein BH10CHL1_BH10CHL1_14850 [soil metagenome]
MFAPRHVEAIDSAGTGAVIAAIITGGGLGVAMAHEFLHGDDVGAVVEQFNGEGAAVVMRDQFGNVR